MKAKFLYRVQIVRYPEGALMPDPHDADESIIDRSWKPEGWAPDEYWIETHGHGSDDFFWPSTYKEWRSRSGATKCKQLIESYGATCVIQRSSEIHWPADGYERLGQEHLSASARAVIKGIES